MDNRINYLGYETRCILKEGKILYISTASAHLKGLEYKASEIGATVRESENNAKKALEAILNIAYSRLGNHQCVTVETPATVSKNEMRGGGSKPITEKQVGYIRRLALGHNVNVDKYIFEKFNKKIEDLFGTEADAIIKKLQR